MAEDNNLSLEVLIMVECALHNKGERGEDAKERLLTLYGDNSLSQFNRAKIKETMIILTYNEYREKYEILSEEEIKHQMNQSWKEKGHIEMSEYVIRAITNRTDIANYFKEHSEDCLDKVYYKIKNGNMRK